MPKGLGAIVEQSGEGDVRRDGRNVEESGLEKASVQQGQEAAGGSAGQRGHRAHIVWTAFLF